MDLRQLEGLDTSTRITLAQAGIRSVEDLARADPERARVPGISPDQISEWKAQAAEVLSHEEAGTRSAGEASWAPEGPAHAQADAAAENAEAGSTAPRDRPLTGGDPEKRPWDLRSGES